MNMAARGCMAATAAAIMLGATAAVPARAADPTPCTAQEKSNQTLGEKLNQTNGVICPPEVDPAMKAPTPKTGDAPVIPPPGTPGGNSNLQPK